jgi:hypothetical protein
VDAADRLYKITDDYGPAARVLPGPAALLPLALGALIYFYV